VSVDTGRKTGFGSPGVSRYDLLLWILPLPLLLGAVYGATATVSLSTGVGLGGLPSVVILGYGLFVDDPATVLRPPN
jgi:hypothetical protein